MDREGGSKSHAKQIQGLNMQQYAAMKLINKVPDPVVTIRNPNPTQTRTIAPDPNPKPNRETHAPPHPAVQPRAAAAASREQDQYLPIANVIRIMRRILPPHAKISDEAKETVQECVSEYISFITGEANDRCRREQRKTVTAEDVLWAMTKLGFDSYIAPLSLYLTRYRELEASGGPSEVTVTGAKRRAPSDCYPPLVPATASASASAYSNYSSSNSPSSSFSVMPVVPGMFYNVPGAGDYLMMPPDGTSGSSSGQEIGGPMMASNFDPFGQFK